MKLHQGQKHEKCLSNRPRLLSFQGSFPAQVSSPLLPLSPSPCLPELEPCSEPATHLFLNQKLLLGSVAQETRNSMEKVQGQDGAVPGLQTAATAGSRLPENGPSFLGTILRCPRDEASNTACQEALLWPGIPSTMEEAMANPKEKGEKMRAWFASGKEEEVRQTSIGSVTNCATKMSSRE